MLKILTVIICFFVVPRGFDKPVRFGNEYQASSWVRYHLHNMTENIMKDAFYKLRQANVVQSQYVKSSVYEVGKIIAGIIEHYRHMITIYRNYSHALTFESNTHTIKEILNAYSVVQGDYNEIIREMISFQEVLDEQLRVDGGENTKIKKLAKKYNMADDLLLQMIEAGVDVEGFFKADERNKTYKRMMRMMKGTGDLYDTLLDVNSMDAEASSKMLRSIFEENGMEGFDFPKEKSFNAWVKKNENNSEEAEYKKSLRYKKWAEKWDGFNPDIEGVDIADKIAKMGLKNASDFFMNELKEDF